MGGIEPIHLRRYAGQIGLDLTEFERCLSVGVHRAAVRRDLDEGTQLGVTGTPAFFLINGRPLSGAQPLEVFVRLIEDELARTAGPPTGPKREGLQGKTARVLR